MFLSDVAIRRPVFTAMMSLALVVFGILSYRKLAVDQFPAVDFPIMLVQTVWPGAAPADIERDVTQPIEKAVASVPGLEKQTSITRDSVSLVVLQFEIGVDLSDAVSSVRDKVGGVRGELPTEIDDPVIRQIDIGALPVMVVALSAPGGVNEAREIADERLRPFLEQVPGVGSVGVLGGQDREIQVDLDLDALAALDLPAQQVAERIGYENVSLPVGEYDTVGFTVGVRAEGQYTSVEDLANTVVHMSREGRQVRLHEVARVTDGFEKASRYVRSNRQEAVAIEIVKRSGANTVEVAHGVEEKLKEVVPTLGAGIGYAVISNQSHDIEANAHEVWVAIWFGGAAAVLVILFFLLDLRGTIISSLALPTSVIGTFAAMAYLGFSINMMTLLGLSLAIGLLIDDAVVVREAITRRLEAGDSPEEAASKGTKEIALAVLATTMSLVAVFVPVAFMSGMIGQFFRQFGLTIAVAVLLSLFVAFTLDPMLSARLSKAHDHHHGPRTGIAGRIERFLDRIDHGYRSVLDVALSWRKTTFWGTVAAFIAITCAGSMIPGEFMPSEDRGEFLADMRLPVGTSLETTEKYARRMESMILGVPGVTDVYTIVGHEDQGYRARYRVKVVDKNDRPEPVSHYSEIVRRILATAPSAQANIAKPGIIDGLGDWPPMMVVLQGEDLDVLLGEANRVKKMLEGIPGTSDVRVSVNPGQAELRLKIDRAVASDRGVPAGLVGSTARMLVDGSIVGSLRDGGREADIRVRADQRYRDDPAAISALPLPSPRGAITLGDVARVTMEAGPAEIQRTNRLRSINVSTQMAPDGNLGAVLEAFEAEMKKAPLPAGYFYTIDGEAADMAETAAAMGLAVVIALVFIYMVLASQFESLAQPFTLLASVPLAMMGAILGLLVMQMSVSMGSQIGMILLMGLVTKNAILLVDGALQNMRDGVAPDPIEAMRLAGPRRLRPILMTSAAMAIGMLPTALGNGIGAEFRAPMAVAVIGGVLSSTFLTLLVIPVIFVWVEWGTQRAYRVWAWVNGSTPPAARAVTAPDAQDEEGEAAK